MTLPVIALFPDKTFSSKPAEQTGWAASSALPHNYSAATKGSISNANLHDQLFIRTPPIAKSRQGDKIEKIVIIEA